jgi:hypothetical protein
MRQIYTSPRLENVERVVALMDEHGIETSMTNRRAWQRDAWKRFSYTRPAAQESWPQVWVVRSADQARARELLRSAGLEPATRFAEELAASRRAGDERSGRAISARIKMILLALIAVVIGLIVLNRMAP